MKIITRKIIEHFRTIPGVNIRLNILPDPGLIDISSGEEESIKRFEKSTKGVGQRKPTKPFEIIDKEKILREEKKKLKKK
jgi:hypothetical protein